MKLQKPRGTRDFLPEEMRKRRFVEGIMGNIAERWGYEEIKTPTFESTELFTIKSGEGIIEEIYAFKDKGGRDISLRPELTAPVMRMYVNEMQMTSKPLKLYYFDNCFRYERPQKGRFREFWQFGVEIIGGKFPDADCEVIALASSILDELNIKARLHIGHLGLIRSILKDFDSSVQNDILRLLDKKDEEGIKKTLDGFKDTKKSDTLIEIINLSGKSSIKAARDLIGDDVSLHELDRVVEMLNLYCVEPKIDFGIARGLDYYNGVVFEIYSDELGAQNQICGGGSYRLAGLFGGTDVVSTGFAFGFDRTLEVCNVDLPQKNKVVVAATDDTRGEAIKIALKLREYVPTYFDIMQKGLKSQLSFANTIGASYAVIIGKKELLEHKVTLKDMKTQKQELVDLDECVCRVTFIS